ncbi:hypothetical protein BDD12DRAFT_803398 [Trichophaea hybrida]|nr:hypothetical protein BDD12DRAFT_803398 [Trichophaea hybrida]
MCQTNSARGWLEHAIRIRKNRDVYLVVGINTLTDAKVMQIQQQSKTSKGDVEIPIRQIVGTWIGVMGKGGIGIGGCRTFDCRKAAEFVVPGQQVYAVQYRRVEFVWYSSRDINKAFLEDGNCWKVYVSQHWQQSRRRRLR